MHCVWRISVTPGEKVFVAPNDQFCYPTSTAPPSLPLSFSVLLPAVILLFLSLSPSLSSLPTISPRADSYDHLPYMIIAIIKHRLGCVKKTITDVVGLRHLIP